MLGEHPEFEQESFDVFDLEQGLKTPARTVLVTVQQHQKPARLENFNGQGNMLYRDFRNPRQAQNQLPLAINEYTRALELEENPALLYQLASTYLLNGQFDLAETYLDKLKETQLNGRLRAQVYETRARLLFYQGHVEKAKTVLKQGFSMKSLTHVPALLLQLTAIQFGLYKQAPSFFDSVKCLSYFLLTLASSGLFKPVTVRLPALRFYGLKMLKPVMGEEWALEAYLTLYKRYPGLYVLLISIGKLYEQREQFSEAEFWFTRAVERYPLQDEAYRCLAGIYQMKHQPEMLVEILETWLKIHPKSGEIRLALSHALAFSPDNYEAAIREAKLSLLSLRDKKMMCNLYLHLGNLYSQMEQYDNALLAYQCGTTTLPTSQDAYVNLGTLYYELKEYLLAQQTFEIALKLSPDNSRILCNLGYLAWMQDNIKTALQYYQQSVTLEPSYDIATNNLGVLYLDHVGDVRQAIKLFEQTLTYNPLYALCYYNLGRAYSFLGKTVEAAHSFQQAQLLNIATQELDAEELEERIKQLFEANGDALAAEMMPRDPLAQKLNERGST